MNGYVTPPARPAVATVVAPGSSDATHDHCDSWETAQAYAATGYVVIATADDGTYWTKERCQALYDAERDRFIDCWGRTTPFEH